MADTSSKIRDLNDRFRLGDDTIPGHVYVTSGVQSVIADGGKDALANMANAVREYSDFNPDNDPHGEHDFGAFEIGGEKLFWKIDYYSPDLQHGSEDPSDLSVTLRVLTIMLASEY